MIVLSLTGVSLVVESSVHARLRYILYFCICCLVPLWLAYTKRALKEVHFFTKVPDT